MSHPHPPSASTAAWQLLAVLALVLANGFFVASEFALVSVRKSRVDQLAAEGNHSAVLVQQAIHQIKRYIAATQVGITVASLMLGGLGEQTLEPMLRPLFNWMPEPVVGITRAGVATGVAYFVMTTFHVILGELLPKSIALHQTESMAMLLVRPMNWFATLVTPLIWMLNGAGNFLLARIGIHPVAGHGQVHSPEELDLLFTQSHQGGELTATEVEILHRVVKFSDVTAREVMVPRVEMQALPLEMPRSALTAFLHGQPHTRVPIFRGSLDDLIGIAHLKDLVRFEASLAQEAPPAPSLEQEEESGAPSGLDGGRNGTGFAAPTAAVSAATPAPATAEETISLMPVVRETARVPVTTTMDKLLVEFKKRRQQMAIVIDEYGGTSGIVTMGDLLEQVFGDVHDEFDPVEPEIVQREDGRVQLSGRVLIDEVNERYGLGFRADEVDTIAGLVLANLGRPARVGDEVHLNGADLRVEGIDRLRITALSLGLPRQDPDATKL